MYIVTSIICAIKTKGIVVENKYLMQEALNVIKIIFTPINAMIVLAPLGNVLGKMKDEVIDIKKGKRRLLILIILIILVFIFEANYIEDFVKNLLFQPKM